MLDQLALIVHGLTLGSIYALVALGFHLLYRAVGVLDFGQGDKVVIGGLVGLSLLRLDVPIAAVFAIVVVGGLLAGLVYDTAVLRPVLPRGVEPATIGTVGALLALGSGHVLIWGATGERFPALVSGSVHIGKTAVEVQSFIIWAVAAAAVAIVVIFLTGTRYGKGMVAAATDPLAAGTVGINVVQVRVIAGAIAFALAGLGGLLIAPITLAGGTIGASLTLRAFTGAILGGIESTGGVIFGAVLLGVVEDVLGGHIRYEFVDPTIFSVLILTLLLFPAGIFGRKRRLA